MSTRSFIGIKNGKEFKTIYCHYDGYPKCNGAILLKHYNSLERVEALLSLGYISSLNKNLLPDPTKPHTFSSKQKDVVVAYHRDRGDAFTPPKNSRFATLEKEDWNYIFSTTTNTWFVKSYSGKWQRLDKVIAKLDPETLFA